MRRSSVSHVIATQICDGVTTEGDAKERLNLPIFRALMQAKGIRSVAELARRSGVSKSTIFRLRAGESCSLPVARALARHLDTTVETLFANPDGPKA